MQKFKRICILLLSVILILGCSFSSYADLRDLMIGSSSNALMTLDLNDDDYGVSLYSSLASIKNTVDYSSVYYFVVLIDEESGMERWDYYPLSDDGSLKYFVPNGYVLKEFGFDLRKGAIPSSGMYRLRIDYASDVSLDYNRFGLQAVYRASNVAQETSGISQYSGLQQSSGDFYFDDYVKFTNPALIDVQIGLSDYLEFGSVLAGDVKFNFTSADSYDIDMSPDSGGFEPDYNSDMSNSLSDLSSSMDTVSEEVGAVAEAIQNLQGAMEPHYSNVLTQLHHITEQLHAFYDQVYNNIHLPELGMLTQIKEAIENIDLQIEVDISDVKTAINNMSTAVQNKLQSTTDQITGGFDNSGITQENEKLEQSINQYDEVESGIFEDAEGFIGDFEYPSVDSLPLGIIKALAFIGSILQGIFLSMGDFSVIITFSLTMIFVMVIVGYHRIRS